MAADSAHIDDDVNIDEDLAEASGTEQTPSAAATETANSPTASKNTDDLENAKRRAVRLGIPLKGATSSPLDEQRIQQRKQRFGTLSEEEKRAARVRRFSASSTEEVVDKSIMSDEKLRSRAQRFGLPIKPDPKIENEKKRKRMERFATDLDPEEVKRQKRIERFAAK